MDREPLDSIEYESTYIELRPEWERVTHRREAPNFTRHSVTAQVDVGVIASSVYAAANMSIETPDVPRTPASPHNLAGEVVGRWRPPAVHPPGGPLRVTARWCPGAASGHLASRRRARSWPLLRSSLVVGVSAWLGIVAALDPHAVRSLFIGVSGVLVLGWARLAWRGTPRAQPFGATATRGLDRLVTALGTFFAIALWASYAPAASAGVSRTVVLLLSGVGLIRGVPAAIRSLLRRFPVSTR